MANYILSYDLNGPVPTHAQMDQHIRTSGASYGRILETVWYIKTSSTLEQVYHYMNRILRPNDRILVVEASDMYMRNLLVSPFAIKQAWAKAA